MWMTCGDTTRVCRESIDGLPPRRKAKVYALLGNPIDANNIRYVFAETDSKRCDEASKIITDYWKNRKRAEHRKWLELVCEGTYAPDDIKSIYDIQQGRCYFSGKPISLEMKDYSVDHLKPVWSGGSFWPGNLALLRKKINQDKHGRTKTQYWKILEETKGRSWVAQQKARCADVDKARRAIDRVRRRAVRDQIDIINSELQQHFDFYEFEPLLRMESGQLLFEMEEIEIRFPPGILRKKKKWEDASYLISLVDFLRHQ